MIIEILYGLLNLLKKNKINLANYKTSIDYGILSLPQREAFDNILCACKERKTSTIIPTLSQKEFDGVIANFSLYFGNADISKNLAIMRQNTAIIYLDVYDQAVAHKSELDSWVDGAIASLSEGTVEDKLKQIMQCIAKNSKYKVPSSNPLDLLKDGAICGAYAMLFYKMASRIGIKTFICIGEADNGSYKGAHAWNMVKINEQNFFYDPTWYDSSSRNNKYVHSSTAWDREYVLNAR